MYSKIKDPYTFAFNKLYFVNMFSENVKCESFDEAIRMFPRLASIAEKLGEMDLEFLIQKIESVQ